MNKIGIRPFLKSLHHDKLHNTIHSTILDTFGVKTFKTCDWFLMIIPVIEHLQYTNLPNSKKNTGT